MLGAPHRAASAAKLPLALGVVSRGSALGCCARLSTIPKFASLRSYQTACETAPAARKPAWNKAQNRAISPVRVSVHVPQGFFTPLQRQNHALRILARRFHE
jgi:hypothetical protein